MNEIYSGERAESPRTTEERAVIRESREAQRGLRTEVENSAENRQYKRHFRGLNFHYNTTNILENGGNIIKRLNEKFKDDDSLEGVLFNNPQVKKLLSNIVSAQAKDIRHERRIYERLSAKKKAEDDKASQDNNNTVENEGLDGNEIEEEPVESWEDYKYNQSSLGNFEDFILSDEGITVIVNEIKRHINEKTGEVYPDYPISEDILKLRLKNAWDTKLLRDYNEKNGDPTTDKNKDDLDRLGNILEDGIDNIVGDYIKSGGSKFDKSLMNSIEHLLLEKGDKDLLNKENDTFKGVLREKIKNFSSIVLKSGKFSLNTGNKQIDLQLRSYLFMYGKIFHPNLFKIDQGERYYENTFSKIMGVILYDDGYDELENIVKNNEFLEQERKAEEARRKRDEQKRREIAKRNRERNNNYTPGGGSPKPIDNSAKGKTGDLQEASGAQIAERYLNLGDFKVNTGMAESITKNEFARNRAFSVAWKNFINSHNEIAEIVTDKDMRKLYDTEKKTIDETAWEEFLQSDIMKGKSPDEINRIRSTLLAFSSDFENALKQLASQASAMEGRTNDKIRNYAIGSVIDNVRFIFADIVEKWKSDSKFEGFRFNGSEPVKREGNDIIISGTFNGSAIKIRYDLLSGGLFMNSFLHHLSPSKVTIGKNNNADLQIGQLESFDTILDKHYRAPDISSGSHPQVQNRGPQSSPEQDQGGNPRDEPEETDTGKKLHFAAQFFVGNRINNEQTPSPEPVHDIPTDTPSQPGSFGPAASEIRVDDKGEMEAIKKKYRDMLNANLDMISNSIVDHTKRQSAVNSIITKFMTTFNIMSPSGGFSSLDFNDGSNLFDVIQIIEKTADPKDGDIQSLEYFNNTFMPVAMEYSGLKWGERNDRQDKEGQKSKNIFSYNGKNEYINSLKNKTKNFNPEQFSGVANFESQHQLGFADLIKEKIITGKKPNWKLNGKEMEKFVNVLEGKKSA